MKTALTVLALVAVVGMAGGCRCVIPQPRVSDARQAKLGADIAAELQELPLKANLKVDFERKVTTRFADLSDSNAALFLFLNAIHCYLHDGKVGEDVSREMVAIVRARWGAANGLAGLTEGLTPLEHSIVRKSPDARAILSTFGKLGVAVQ